MKKVKALKNAHTSNAKMGSGDYNGTGVKNPTGRMVKSTLTNSVKSKTMGKPPKSLA